MLTWAIPTYTPRYPGYGASPALVANVSVWIMMVMSGLSLVRLLMARYANKPLPPVEGEFPDEAQSTGFTQVGRVRLFHLGLYMIPSALLVVAIDYIGYALASFAFLMAIQYATGCRNWLKATVLSISMVVLLYIIMRYGFGVPIPGPEFSELFE